MKPKQPGKGLNEQNYYDRMARGLIARGDGPSDHPQTTKINRAVRKSKQANAGRSKSLAEYAKDAVARRGSAERIVRKRRQSIRKYGAAMSAVQRKKG